MKKLISLMLVLLMVLALAACSAAPAEEKTEAAPAEGAPAEAATAEETAPEAAEAPAAEPMKLKYFCKNLGDLSYNDKGWEGCQRVAEKYGWTAEVVECGADTATFENAFLDACESGEYDIIVTQAGYGMSDLCIKYAGDYPEMSFFCFDMVRGTDISGVSNMFGMSFEQNEAAFLAGALAGKLTKSNQLGVFLMGDVPALNDFGTGYLAGVRTANDKAAVSIAYGGGVADASKLQEISSAMFDRGIDVIFGCSSSCFPGLAREAYSRGGFEAGLYTIGVDSDMWVTFDASENPQYAEVIASSAMKCIDTAVEYACDKFVDGTIEWGTIKPLGIAEGGTGLAENEYYKAKMPADVQAYIADLKAKILDGSLEVPSYYDFASYDEYAEWRNQMSSIDENSIS